MASKCSQSLDRVNSATAQTKGPVIKAGLHRSRVCAHHCKRWVSVARRFDFPNPLCHATQKGKEFRHEQPQRLPDNHQHCCHRGYFVHSPVYALTINPSSAQCCTTCICRQASPAL
jgi:hypothetical protein